MAESSEEVLKQADIIFKVSQPLLDEVPWVVVTILGHKKKGVLKLLKGLNCHYNE